MSAMSAMRPKPKFGPKKPVAPVVAPPTINLDDSDDSEEEDESTPMERSTNSQAPADDEPEDDEDEDEEDDRFPTLVETPKKGAKGSRQAGRPLILFERVVTDAPLQVNGILLFKNFDTLTFAVSPDDAKVINTALVEEFECDPDKPIVSYSEQLQAHTMRGKPNDALKAVFDGIQTKRSYTFKFTLGKWANPSERTSGVSISVVDVVDQKGNSVVKLDVKFPKGPTFSAGRMLTKEEAAEMKRNQA